MRIAVIAPPWVPVPPTGFGGIELLLDGLCRGLAARGHEVLLFATGDSTCPVDVAWEFEAAVGTDMTPAVELRHTLAAYMTIRRWRPDVVHDHTVAGPFVARSHPELAVVTTNHQPFEGSFAFLYASLAGRVPIVAVSHSQAAAASGTPVAAVIHNAVDVDSFPAGAGQGGYALFLGRMSLRKGVDTAIRTARAAGMPLRVAAKMREPLERRYFTERVEPLLSDGIDYVGESGPAARLDLLGDATCLLNPIGWAEPFGMVMIEALACGTPVIATPRGAAPEIVDEGRTGFLRPDEGSLAAALGQAHTIDRVTCRAVAQQRFSLERLVHQHLAVYEQVRRQNDAVAW